MRWKPKGTHYKYQRPPIHLRPWNVEDQKRLDKIKRDLAHAFDRATFRTGDTQKMIAVRLGTTQSRVSEALGSNLDKVTVNQLIRYLIMIEPHFAIQIAI